MAEYAEKSKAVTDAKTNNLAAAKKHVPRPKKPADSGGTAKSAMDTSNDSTSHPGIWGRLNATGVGQGERTDNRADLGALEPATDAKQLTSYEEATAAYQSLLLLLRDELVQTR